MQNLRNHAGIQEIAILYFILHKTLPEHACDNLKHPYCVTTIPRTAPHISHSGLAGSGD
jgi:hypothetical protein